MMIPDAPEIRDAELNGYPESPNPDPVCPACGAENPEYFYLVDGQTIGCCECVERKEGGDWAYEKWEAERDE